MDAVSVGNLMFRPESRVPLDGLSVSESLSLLSFGPRLMCEHVRTKNTTSSCGHGGEFGWSRRSADGLGQLTSKISVDRIGASRRTGIQINFERQF